MNPHDYHVVPLDSSMFHLVLAHICSGIGTTDSGFDIFEAITFTSLNGDNHCPSCIPAADFVADSCFTITQQVRGLSTS
jgi:hypothetical protein